MIKIIILIITTIVLNGCATTGKDFGYKNTILIKSYDTAKRWDVVPVGLKIEPAMEPGDVLILKHREHEIAKVFINGNIQVEELRFQIRALGTGKLVAFLHKPDGSQSAWSRSITVNKFGNIPKKNTKKLTFKQRISHGSVDIIIINDSAETGFVKKAAFKFSNGEVDICGSKYLAANPYLRVKPVKFTGTPEIKISLAKSRTEKCDM